MIPNASSSKKNIPAHFRHLLKESFSEMRKNDPLRMAGATAFFTTFALPPIMIILFQSFSLFADRKYVGTEIMKILSTTFGKLSADQIRITTRGFRNITHNWFTTILGFLFLVFVATTLFRVIKNTLNDIWKIGIKDHTAYKIYLFHRAKSFAVILLAGILFLIAIFLDSIQVIAGNSLNELFHGGGKFFKGALNEITSAVLITTWFILLFRFLADGRPPWRVAIAGGIVTGILFSIGKAVLSFLMRNSNIGKIYGTSGSLVLIFLFVFYSSFILYYGASFIKVYAETSKQFIKSLPHAFHYQLQKVES
jgi:membrane protein